MQIVIFLIVAAALGFVVGWLMRGGRAEADTPHPAPGREGVEAALAEERDRLRAELRAARDAQARLQASLKESESLAETRAARVRELEGAAAEAQRLAETSAPAPQLDEEHEALENKPDAPPEPAPAEDEGSPPQGMAAPEGAPDNLKKISGIGPSIEKTLHELGVYHFRQIAAFTPDNVAWVNQRLRFKGRIEREDWIGQAKKLAGSEPG